ncbi:MAG: hypothetical protein WCG91_03065 [Candidatus Shapirobacteria bacterium]
MKEIFEILKNKSKRRIAAGILLMIFGLAGCLLPIIPGFIFIGLGLEVIGIRLILQEKFKRRVKYPKFIDKILDFRKHKW